MQYTNHSRSPRNRAFSLFATAAGMLGFMASFTLALQVFLMEGNPGFLLIWLFAAAAALASMRFSRRWCATMERIGRMKARDVIDPLQRKWHGDVEDVTFRDLPSPAGTSIR